MSEPMYRDWILETIDSLRSRKARPDLERICRMVRRRHGSDPERTRSELERLIQEQTVLKVSYKGSISYRNAAKVQRKSRKKTEQLTDGALQQQSKHTLFNPGDSTHSPVAQGESGDAEITKARKCLDSQPFPLPCTPQGDGAVLLTNSGNSCLSCGAVVCRNRARCATVSGDVRTNAPKDAKLPRTGGSSTSLDRDKSTINSNGNGAPSTKEARAMEWGLPGRERYSVNKQNKTCTSASISGNVSHKTHAPMNPRPSVGATGSLSQSDPNSSDLGDRLVASVRSLAKRSRGVAPFGGRTSLGLKEILGFLSSQGRLTQEKLTRSKVKVILEREVARGRLRRTRFGNITLPVRGVVGKPLRPLQSALQDRKITEKEETGVVAMDTDSMEDRVWNGRLCVPRCPGEQDVGASGDPILLRRKEGEMGVEDGARGAFRDPPRPECDAGERPALPAASCPDPAEDPPTCTLLTATPTNTPPALTMETRPSARHPESEQVFSAEEIPTAHGRLAAAEVGVQLPAVSLSVLRVEGNIITPHHLVPGCGHKQEEGMKLSEGREKVTSVPPEGPFECRSGVLSPDSSKDLGVVKDGGRNGGVAVQWDPAGQDPVEWTVMDVASYFTAAGFPEQAVAFRTQEIDGKSLLLMQRSDVLTGLSIRLGPALKIYEHHVKVLQRTHYENDGALC
ncbi:atherin-like [Megalops cyprinoides]|uniref:atherin-like n=1 Tax=Megalops cyprinoides TaxID=118141 RepID=UPI001864E0FE|nr:atherin-like [Megalops cyprinoides]XP_036408104.1 atherin-like [Megalops cyprinoides]